jgi:oligopeptide/dipeptide ABC transporter ATP-binding protein
VVLITHDLGVVAEFCDTVHVMYAGRVVETGTTAELFAAPAHPYSRALLASLPLPGRSRDEELQWIPGAPPSLSDLPQGCSYAARCPIAIDACRTEQPQPVIVEGDSLHWAECFLADQVEHVGIPSTSIGGHNV